MATEEVVAARSIDLVDEWQPMRSPPPMAPIRSMDGNSPGPAPRRRPGGALRASDVSVEPGEDSLHPINPAIRAPVVLHLVVLVGVEDQLDVASEHLESGEELLVVRRRAESA